MTRTTPLRRTTLHLLQIFLTEARTFMVCLQTANGLLCWPGASPDLFIHSTKYRCDHTLSNWPSSSSLHTDATSGAPESGK